VGVEPTQAEALRIFMPTAAFAARARRCRAPACGLWSGLSLHRLPMLRGLGAARLVSTPSRRKFSVQAWLGIAISGFPEFGQFCIAGFPASTQVFLKSAAYAIPPRPRGLTLRLPMIEQPARIYTYVSEFGRGVSERLTDFCVFFGLMMLIAAASRLVLMCAA
jgi:hypothetical protein